MLTCKQVSNALSKEDYRKLSPLRRFFLRLHIRLCIFCGKFNKQVMESQDMCRYYKEVEDTLGAKRPAMDEGKKTSSGSCSRLSRRLPQKARPSTPKLPRHRSPLAIQAKRNKLTDFRDLLDRPSVTGPPASHHFGRYCFSFEIKQSKLAQHQLVI